MNNNLIHPSFEYKEGTIFVKKDTLNRETLTTKLKENNIKVDNIISVIFDQGTTTVGKRIFRNFPNLEEIILSNTVIKIENDAFRDCERLKDIYIYGEKINLSEAFDAFRNNNHLDIFVVNSKVKEEIIKYKELLGLKDFNIVLMEG